LLITALDDGIGGLNQLELLDSICFSFSPSCLSYPSYCSNSLVAFKALKAIRTTSPLVHQCQKALSDVSIRHAVGLFWVPGHAGIRGNEIADGIARGGTALRFLGPEPALGDL